jgi:hypothetical protein
MILLRALLHADQELVVLVHQGLDQRLVIAGKTRDELREGVRIGTANWAATA